MRVKDSNLTDLILDIHVSENGIYYFFYGFIIGEINEDVNYTWESAQDIIKAAKNFYGDDMSICYISNRVNQYSVNPSDWLKFFRDNDFLNGYANVTQSEIGWINSVLEKIFLSTKFERFTDLYKAIEWAKDKNKEVNKKILNKDLVL